MPLTKAEREMLGEKRASELDAELEEHETARKASFDKLLVAESKLRDERQAHTSTKEGSAKAIADATSKYRRQVHEADLTRAIIGSGIANMNPNAIRQAVRTMIETSKIETLADGRIKQITLADGLGEFASVEAAAEIFLENHDSFHRDWEARIAAAESGLADGAHRKEKAPESLPPEPFKMPGNLVPGSVAALLAQGMAEHQREIDRQYDAKIKPPTKREIEELELTRSHSLLAHADAQIQDHRANVLHGGPGGTQR